MEGNNRRRCVWKNEERAEGKESRSIDAARIESEICVTRTEFERADLAKKRVAFQTKTKFG